MNSNKLKLLSIILIWLRNGVCTLDLNSTLFRACESHERVPRQASPAIVNNGNQFTCICIPPNGICSTTPLPTTAAPPAIDPRIVNNGGQAPGPAPTTPAPAPQPAPACQPGLLSCCQPGPYRCGIRYPPPPNSRTPQLGQAPIGAYPWQIILITPLDTLIGSGAIIDARHVITVAHKVSAYQMTPNQLRVRAGEWDIMRVHELYPHQNRRVMRITIHPSYNNVTLENDIAVLRLDTPFVLTTTSTVASVCLPERAPVSQMCYVSGWGQNDFTTPQSYNGIIKHVDVTIKSATQCQTDLRTKLGPTYIFSSTSFICAGGEAGKDACLGDGGAPLVCFWDSKWNVVGLVAWGVGCGNPGVPGAYVNVFSYRPWIMATTQLP